MKIKIESIDLPEETVKDFAIFLGWTEKVMTTTESPNYEIDNPITFIDYIGDKYGDPIWTDVTNWNLQTAQEEADAQIAVINAGLETAKAQAETEAKETVLVTVE